MLNIVQMIVIIINFVLIDNEENETIVLHIFTLLHLLKQLDINIEIQSIDVRNTLLKPH